MNFDCTNRSSIQRVHSPILALALSPAGPFLQKTFPAQFLVPMPCRFDRDVQDNRGNVPIGREGYAVAGVCASNVFNLCYFDRRAATS